MKGLENLKENYGYTYRFWIFFFGSLIVLEIFFFIVGSTNLLENTFFAITGSSLLAAFVIPLSIKLFTPIYNLLVSLVPIEWFSGICTIFFFLAIVLTVYEFLGKWFGDVIAFILMLAPIGWNIYRTIKAFKEVTVDNPEMAQPGPGTSNKTENK